MSGDGPPLLSHGEVCAHVAWGPVVAKGGVKAGARAAEGSPPPAWGQAANEKRVGLAHTCTGMGPEVTSRGVKAAPSRLGRSELCWDPSPETRPGASKVWWEAEESSLSCGRPGQARG